MRVSLIKELLIGYCLGTANIIPGVSGGTFLLVFNIYERVFAILSNINKTTIVGILSRCYDLAVKPCRNETLKNLIRFLEEKDFIFLFKLLVGAVVAILSLSTLIEYLVVNQFSMTYALFFGLILVSIVIPVKMLKKRQASLLFFLAFGAVATIYVTWAVNPYDRVEKKSNLYKVLYQTGQGAAAFESSGKAFSFTGKYSLDEYLYAAACGAVSVSAMVLPGVSGSLVLILMGQYFEVISAISGLKTLNPDDILFLACFSMGIVFGGLFFARLISLVLKRHYDETMAFLIGLMTGSLYALWPFKKSIIMAEQYIKEDGVIKVYENVRIYTNVNELPAFGPDFFIAVPAFVAGCLIMFFFVRQELGN